MDILFLFGTKGKGKAGFLMWTEFISVLDTLYEMRVLRIALRKQSTYMRERGYLLILTSFNPFLKALNLILSASSFSLLSLSFSLLLSSSPFFNLNPNESLSPTF